MDLATEFLSFIMPLIPAEYTAYVAATGSFLIALANLIRVFWKPPAAGTRAATIYHLIEAVSRSRGWNSAAYAPVKKAIMVPV